MALPKTGRFGKLQVPVNQGILFSNVALAKVSSQSIGGRTYTNQFFSHSSGYWNKSSAYKASWRLQGIVGEAAFVPTTSNDEVKTEAAISYWKDNSTVQTAAADSSISLAACRPAAASSCWALVIITMSTGAITAVKGKDIAGAITNLVNTFGDPAAGADGAIPFTTSDQLIIGALKLGSNVAAPIAASEIYYTDGTGRLLQERSDIPGGREILLDGGVLFDAVILPSKTADACRVPYATFYSQESVIADVADLVDWKLSTSRSIATMPGKGYTPTASETNSPETATGTASFYMNGKGRWDLFRMECGYVKLFQDSRDTGEYFEGTCMWNSFDENNDESAIKNTLNFTIDGFLERRGS